MKARRLLTLVMTVIVGVNVPPQARGVSARRSPAQQPSVTSQQPSVTTSSPMSLSGTVVQADGHTHHPVPGAHVRLRRVDDGTIVGQTVADARGAFSLSATEPGFYVVEVVAENGEVLGVSNPVSSATTSVTTVVIRSSRVAGGFFTGSALSILAAAAGAGISAAFLGGAVQPVSPQQ